MSLVKNKKITFVVLALCFISVAGLTLFQHLTSNNSELGLFNPFSNADPYPKLIFKLDHSHLDLKPGDSQTEAAHALFDLLGYSPNVDRLYLPKWNNQNMSLQPQTIVFNIQHISNHAAATYGPLISPSVINGKQVSGFTCNEHENPTVLYCNLFFDETFFEKSDLQQTESYLTLTTLNTLAILTQESIDYQTHIEQYPQLVKDYQQILEQEDLQLVKVVKKNENKFNPLESIKQLISGFLIPRALAQYDHCDGHLSCKQWDYDCLCPDGVTACTLNVDCPDGPCTDCDQTCGTVVELDPYWCEKYGGDTCRSPLSGTCETTSSIYCETVGVCYVEEDDPYSPPPEEDPTPPPPTPTPPTENCPNCCPNDMVCISGRYADLDGYCAADEMCCLECGYIDNGGPRGQVRVWFFYDSNRNGQFDPEDQALPSSVITNTRLRLHLLNKDCTDGESIWACTAEIAANHTIPPGPGIAGVLIDDRCDGEEGNFDGCSGENGVCCNHTPTFFQTCWGTCQNDNRAGSDSWDREVGGVRDNIGDWWFKNRLFWDYYMGDDYTNPTLNYDNHKLATGTWGGFIADYGDGGGINYEVVNLPEGYEVSVIRNQDPMDANIQETVYDQSYLNNRYIKGVADSEVTQQLVVVGITPEIRPPQVQNVYSETEFVCVANQGSSIINIETEYWDPETEPGFAKLLDNGSFENELEGWTLYAASNLDSHSFYRTLDQSKFNQYSVAINKGAETTWGPQINHSLPTLNASQPYTYSVWAKAPNSAQFILQRYPTEGCTGYASLASASHPGGNEWRLLKFSYSPSDQCARYAQIILSSGGSNVGDTVYFDGLAIEEGAQPGIFSDIKYFQVNIEAQPIETPMTYRNNYWPIRLMLNRMDHGGTAANHFKIIHAPSGDFANANIQFDSNFNRYYLAQDLTIQNGSGDNVATLLSSDPQTNLWRTYFTLEYDRIFAHWAVEIESGFPSTDPAGIENFHISAHVRDFYGLEDSRTGDELGDRTTFYIPEFFATWHRLDTLNTIQPNIDFNIWEGDSCGSSPVTSVSVNHARIELDSTFSPYFDNSSYSMTPDSCEDTHNVTLDLTEQTGTTYVCGCDNGTDGNSFTCEYFDVDPTHDTGVPINFFVQAANLSHGPWFQSVGGNILASGGDIQSYIPNDGSGPCVSTLGCEPALLTSLPWSTDNADTPGFPLAAGSVDTVDGDGQYSNIHDGNRSQSENGRVEGLTNQLPQRGYTYYYNKFGFNGETLASNTMPSDLSTSDLNIYQHIGDLTISDTNSWNVLNNVKLVVFVNGDLTFSGSNSNITNVDTGGFLAFIVSGDIIIDNSVGHNMSSGVAGSASNTPSTATSNLEGVFIAQNITVQSAGTSEIDNKLIAEGTFVGWNSVTLERDFADEGIGATHNIYNPTETFIHRPDLVVNMPVEMKEALHEWREVNPSQD